MISKNKDGPLTALKISPIITSVMVLLLVLGESFNLLSGVLIKILEYIQALGR